MAFDCPFCTAELETFEQSDEHLIEHTTEYNMAQDMEFGTYSK